MGQICQDAYARAIVWLVLNRLQSVTAGYSNEVIEHPEMTYQLAVSANDQELALSMWTPGTHSVVSRRGVQSSETTSGTRTCIAKSVSAITSSRNFFWQRASYE